MMEYKGYIGKAEVDDEAGILHGEVINIRDVITFEGSSVDEVHKAYSGKISEQESEWLGHRSFTKRASRRVRSSNGIASMK